MEQDNFIGSLQEHLQQRAPLLGARPEELYRIEEERQGDCFRARVVLRNVRGGGDRFMGWSPWHRTVKQARQASARRALVDLANEHPHDPTSRPLVVHIHPPSHGSGNTSMSYAQVAALPVGYDRLVPPPTMLWSEVREPLAHAKEDLDLRSNFEDDSSSEGDLSNGLAVKDRTSMAPTNLGALGEEYAFWWLRQQPWVQSVVWLNLDADAQHDHDFECLVDKEGFGRSHVEVKTRWRGCRRAAPSLRQANRLRDAEDDFMLLIVGNFRNLFADPLESPVVRCLPNVLEERILISEECVGFVIGKNGTNVKRIVTESKARVCIRQAGKTMQHEARISAVDRSTLEIATALIEGTFVRISIPIPLQSVGQVIGRKGTAIRYLQQETGARIQIAVDGDLASAKIKGPLKCVERARMMLEELC